MIWDLWKSLRSLLPRRSRSAIGALAVASLLSGILEALVLVLVVSSALGISEGDDAVEISLPIANAVEFSILTALAWAAAAGAVMLAGHLAISRLTSWVSAEVIRLARKRIMVAFSESSWARQSEDREGALQETVSSLASQSSVLVLSVCNFIAAVMGLGALMLAAFIVSPTVTLVVLAFGVAIFVILRPISRRTQRRAREFVSANSELTEGMTQWSTMAMELRVFGVERVELERLMVKNDATADALRRTRFAALAGANLYKDLAILFLVGGVAGLQLSSGIDLVQVGAVLLLVVRSLSYAQQTNSALQLVYELRPNMDALLVRVASLQGAVAPVGGLPLGAISSIEFVDVAYEYEPGRVGVRGLSLRISAGDAIGIIGPSGGGKSTFAQVLMRLRPPTQGSVLVSGVPYEEIDSDSWRRAVAFVSQETRLFRGTVAENIAFSREWVSTEEVVEAARWAHVLDDIRSLPEGFDTPLGPRGAGLSGGQRQRLAIARALVGKPQVLVLDEPTSALDVRSERLLQETIDGLKGRVTLIIIAHRLTTLACCDRVVGMADGEVRVVGTMEEALAHVAFEGE